MPHRVLILSGACCILIAQPPGPSSVLAQIDALLQQQRTGAAIAIGEKYLKENPTDEAFKTRLNNMYWNYANESIKYNMGMIDINIIDKLEYLLISAWKLKPEDDSPLNELTLAFAKCGKTDKALYLCDQRIKINNKNENAWYEKAYIYGSLRRYTEGKECIKTAYSLKPDSSTIIYLYGIFAIETNDKDKLKELYDKLIIIDPAKAAELSTKQRSGY